MYYRGSASKINIGGDMKSKSSFLTLIIFFIGTIFYINESFALNNNYDENPITNLEKHSDIKKIMLNGTPDDVKKLISNDFDVNKNYGCTSVLNKAIQSLIWSENENSTPEDTIKKIDIIISAGANVNLEICNMTPLAMAVTLPQQIREVEKNYMRAIDTKTDSSPDLCNVNGISKPCKETTAAERVVMKTEINKIFADEQKKLEPYIIKIIGILLHKGADINQKSHGVAPIHFAANIPVNGSTEILKYLLEKGANPNATEMQGNTPLFIANFADNKKVQDLLITFGADKTIKNNKGELYNQFKTGEANNY